MREMVSEGCEGSQQDVQVLIHIHKLYSCSLACMALRGVRTVLVDGTETVANTAVY